MDIGPGSSDRPGPSRPRPRALSGPIGPVLALLEDLEQQAEGLRVREREIEVADRAKAEYARVEFAARIHALAGLALRFSLVGGLSVDGEVLRTGPDWLLVEGSARQEWLIRHQAIATVQGASGRAVSAGALGVLRALPIRSILRELGDQDAVCRFHLVDATTLEGRLLRVGADFAELRIARGDRPGHGFDLLRLDAVAAVQRQA